MIRLYDISDHLPNFLKIDNFNPPLKIQQCKQYRRLTKLFNLKHFIADLQEHLQNIDVANSNSNVNNDSKQLTSFEFLVNKHTPLQPLSNYRDEKSKLMKTLD